MSQTSATVASTPTVRDSRWAQQRAGSLCSVILTFILLPGATFAEEPVAPDISAAWAESERSTLATSPDKAPFTFSPTVRLTNSPLLLDGRSLLAQRDKAASRAANVNLTTSAPPWGTQKSYLIPALEIVGFDVLLNLLDRVYYGCCDFDTDLSSISRNLRRGWVVDDDKFTVNQLVSETSPA